MPRPTLAAKTPVLNDLPFCLARASLNFRRFSDQTLRVVGLERLAPGLASVLHALEDLGDCTVNQLVDKTHLPNGTLSGLLDTLEKEAFVKRCPNPEDGRSWLLVLTPKGRKVCSKLDERHRLVLGIFAKTFSKEEAAALAVLLEKAGEGMRAYCTESDKAPGSGGRRSSKRKA